MARVLRQCAVLFALALLLASASSSAVGRLLTLGSRQVFEFSGRADTTLLPATVTVSRLSLEREQLRDVSSPGTITIRLRWGDETFAADAAAESRRQVQTGRVGYKPVVWAPALVAIHLPTGGGKVQRFERAIALPVGREETVSLGIGSDALNESLTIWQQAGAFPPITVEVLWEDVSVPLNTEGHPTIETPKDTAVRRVAARLPAPFRRPQDLLLRTIAPSGQAQEMTLLQSGPVEIWSPTSLPMTYHVVQPTGSSLENLIAGTLPTNVLSADYILPVASRDLIIDVSDLQKIPADVRYVILWVRDSADSVWVHYAVVTDRSRPMSFRIVHPSGVMLTDGLLLGFNEQTNLTGVMTVASDTFTLDDVFLRVGAAKSTADPAVRAGVIQWLEARAGSRSHRAAQSRWLRTSTATIPRSRTETLVAELTDRTRAQVRAAAGSLNISFARAGTMRVNDVGEGQIMRTSPGLWLAIGLSAASSWDTAAPIIKGLGELISTSGREGDLVREEVIAALERLGADPAGEGRRFTQLVLSRGKDQLTAAQRTRYWNQLDAIVIPRDATMDEGFLLATAKPVYFQTGPELRRVSRFLDRLSIDFSALSTPVELGPLSAVKNVPSLQLNFSGTQRSDFSALGSLDRITRLDLSFAGAQLKDQDLMFISRLTGLEQLSVDLSTTQVNGKWIAALTNLTRLRKLSLIMTDCRSLSPESFGPLAQLTRLLELDLKLEGAVGIDDNAMTKLTALTGLQRLAIELARTRVRSKLPVGPAFNALGQLSMSLPAAVDPQALFVLQHLPVLRNLAIRTEFGAAAGDLLGGGWIGRPLRQLQLQMRGAQLNDAGASALGSAVADIMFADLSLTTVTPAAARQICAAQSGRNVQILLTHNQGCQSQGFRP